MQYVIGKDTDGRWVIQAVFEDGTKCPKVFADNTAAIMKAFLMLVGSGYCPAADDYEGDDDYEAEARTA